MREYSIDFQQMLKTPALLAFCIFAFQGFAAGHPAPTAKLETPYFRFGIWEPTGRCEAWDKLTGVVWGADNEQARFGEITLQVGGKPRLVQLAGCKVEKDGASLVATRALPAAVRCRPS